MNLYVKIILKPLEYFKVNNHTVIDLIIHNDYRNR